MRRFCERCGRPLKYKRLWSHQYDSETGQRIDRYMDSFYCRFGRWFGRGNPHGITHDDYVTGTWQPKTPDQTK